MTVDAERRESSPLKPLRVGNMTVRLKFRGEVTISNYLF